ncbi:MAG: 30S ribosomal protein S4 [Candidatus Altiarchaeales archaeon]|nr:30S ribosomal protein S4 [Candidatus Altiarchaeales archaeon]
MGDPRRQRRKYARPTHMWKTERIEEENEIIKKYGLKNKTEIWRARSTVSRFRQQAMNLLARSGEKAEKEKGELMERLTKAGLLKSNTIESILALTVDDLLERRLQTIVYRKGLAKTPRQARQLVTHGQIMVGENAVTIPRYPVKISEEDQVKFKEGVKPPEIAPKKPEAKVEEPTEGVSIGQEA